MNLDQLKDKAAERLAESDRRRIDSGAVDLRVIPGSVESAEPSTPTPIDWSEFWAKEHTAEDWLLEPLIPARRQVAIFSPAKAGKSLLSLELAAAAATGRPVLGRPAREPVEVVYIDLEMTEDDLHERLDSLGYGPDDDLSRLRYYLLPALPPLDTAAGGDTLERIVLEPRAELVVLDTMARVVEGEENQADTYRNFYRHTGSKLKRHGVALVRLDHTGKDPSKGQRGSSSKRDDVDVIWSLKVADNVVQLSSTGSSRVSWVPERVQLTRNERNGVLTHEIPAAQIWTVDAKECAVDLARLEVPLDATVAQAMKTLRANDAGRRKGAVAEALRYRREVES